MSALKVGSRADRELRMKDSMEETYLGMDGVGSSESAGGRRSICGDSCRACGKGELDRTY